MALVNTKKMLKKALKEGYAIPAFNVVNLETAQAVAEVCGEKNAPKRSRDMKLKISHPLLLINMKRSFVTMAILYTIPA